eukprot:CAMPEP_0184743058 /NCGR_PEP_ID=MMETSP0315-20130426/5939_1 /TAXON_ID=101924 /ORGANISM="Rhodosorus marinus, Strain UTEX LB 2760" /LENGTH=52 /DNA_ID=CAMNT_0027214145 /DNA_START=750 /DNA_END=908 /DNA_ORIENTATION=-
MDIPFSGNNNIGLQDLRQHDSQPPGKGNFSSYSSGFSGIGFFRDVEEGFSAD